MSSVETLATTTIGTGPIRYVFCHGLFGSGRNWRSIARRLEPASSLLVDLPNHGRSGWTEQFSYPASAAALSHLLRPLDRGDLTLVGHSMGGRVAMMTALFYPDLIDRLVVVDIAPRTYQADLLATYAPAMAALTPDQMRSRSTADQALRQVIPDERTRALLLTGFQPSPTGGHWQFNVALLARDFDRIMTWPELTGYQPYAGPVLWLRGGRSDYVTAASYPAMRALFPHYQLETVAEAGHWLHADQPDVFVTTLRRFVAEHPSGGQLTGTASDNSGGHRVTYPVTAAD
ncbi:MAG: alpha/beta fold hydrolase [Propionibacteriaceae bacterium]|nr:alpha/beta fold hydrolase [Propionibacteriaceae bacterium]